MSRADLAAATAALQALLDAIPGPAILSPDDPYAPREDGVGREVFVPDPYPWDVNDGEDFRDLDKLAEFEGAL